jgi:hypothetical protein
MTKMSLIASERELILSFSADEDKIWVYASQQKWINNLLKNPLFEIREEHINKNYRCYPKPYAIEGYLPLYALTIRSKKKQISAEHLKKLRKHINKINEAKKQHK